MHQPAGDGEEASHSGATQQMRPQGEDIAGGASSAAEVGSGTPRTPQEGAFEGADSSRTLTLLVEVIEVAGLGDGGVRRGMSPSGGVSEGGVEAVVVERRV